MDPAAEASVGTLGKLLSQSGSGGVRDAHAAGGEEAITLGCVGVSILGVRVLGWSIVISVRPLAVGVGEDEIALSWTLSLFTEIDHYKSTRRHTTCHASLIHVFPPIPIHPDAHNDSRMRARNQNIYQIV